MEATGGKTVYSARYDTLLPAEKSALWDSFSEWRASNCMHQEASISNLKSTLLAMQANFMDQSQYIRGDYVWQKSIAQFLHEMNDLVQGKLDRLYSENESYCSSFCIQIAQFFQQKNKQHQCDLSRERVIFEEKVRKVRQTFKIEKANSAVLEKCLRQQEMLQLKSRFDMSVAQLETEHAEREKLLTQAIIELKSTCNLTQTRAEELSFAYQQNLVEIEQLREEVVASKQSNVSKTVTTPPKEEMTTKSLTDARQSVATLKVKLLEMQAEKMSISERFAQITRDFHKISEDLILMRNHASKLDREMFEKTKRIAELEENSFASKEMRMEFEIGFERLNLALTEKSRLCDCLLEKQERLEKTLLKEIEEANEFDECDVQIKAPASKDSKKNLWEAARKFYDWKSDHSKIEIKVPTDSFTPLQLECSHALQLRLEMEQKFGAQLQARVVQERNFVLAYLRAQNRNKQKAAAFMQTLSSKWKKRQTKAGLPTSYASLRDGSMLAEAESVLDLYTFIEHLVAEAYDKLGYTDWNDTDIAFLQEERNSLKDRVGRYEAQLQHQQEQIQKHLHHAAKSQLLHQEFFFLIEDLILMRNHASKLDREMFEKTKRIAELEENSFASKEMRMEFEIGFERLNLALTEKSRLCDCLLEKQERLEKTLLKEIEEANEFDECDVQIKAPASKDSKKNLWEAARKFYDWKSDHSKIEIKVPTDSFTPLQLECSHALQLRLEMEQKFGAQLQARVVQERNFVLAYLRAQNRNKQKAAAFMQTLSSKWKKRQTKAGLPTSYASLRDGSMLAEAESVLDLYTFIEHLVAEAYDKLGYTDWNDTDIAFLQEERNSLKDRVGRYEAQLQHQQEQIQKHLHHAAKSQLLHQEKEFLLAELNTRHRELRRSYEEAIATRETSINYHLKSNECSVAQNTIKSLSLIHYDKSSSQPAMINTGLRAVGLKSQSPRSEAKNMDESGSFSSLPVRPVGRNPNEKRRDHVRGLLKEELMSTTAHSSNDNHAVVGSDGVS
ncbi:hypothetical protein ABG067_003571 [Albugo candida]